jgi:hypothetical protein
MEDQINSYASKEIPDWFEANFDTIIEDIEDEWNELDDEEKEALETQERLKKRVI